MHFLVMESRHRFTCARVSSRTCDRTRSAAPYAILLSEKLHVAAGVRKRACLYTRSETLVASAPNNFREHKNSASMTSSSGASLNSPNHLVTPCPFPRTSSPRDVPKICQHAIDMWGALSSADHECLQWLYTKYKRIEISFPQTAYNRLSIPFSEGSQLATKRR